MSRISPKIVWLASSGSFVFTIIYRDFDRSLPPLTSETHITSGFVGNTYLRGSEGMHFLCVDHSSPASISACMEGNRISEQPDSEQPGESTVKMGLSTLLSVAERLLATFEHTRHKVGRWMCLHHMHTVLKTPVLFTTSRAADHQHSDTGGVHKASDIKTMGRAVQTTGFAPRLESGRRAESRID